MANITAQDVAALRAKTGLGMMDCKKALVEAEGDQEKAIKILREKGLATAAKKESRIAAEGVVAIKTIGSISAIIEVNTETDFVAKNASFLEFVYGLLETIIAKKPADVAALEGCTFASSAMTVSAALTDKIAVIGEKISIRRFQIVEGTVSTYVHGRVNPAVAAGGTGVIVKFEGSEAALSSEKFAEVGKNIALQIASGNPPTYIAKEDVPQSAIDEEIGIQIAAAKNDPKLANKPDEVLKKIVQGKMDKLFFEKVCLNEQLYVKDDSMKVGAYLKASAKELGGEIKVVQFVLFEKGEGIQKREENFAEEIAKLAGK
ncbi:MAG: elongation factor Ts [Clostridia bacterium]|nr:elongation factor Ts [Clostridia bacterium]